MAKIHIKGRLLQMLDDGLHWDYELADRLASEYIEVHGTYWHDTIRLTLADLHSGGLVYHEEEALDLSRTHGVEKPVFRCGLTEFGRERMRQTGLVAESMSRKSG